MIPTAFLRRINRIIANAITRVDGPRERFYYWLQHTGLLVDNILLHDGTPFLFHGMEIPLTNYLFMLGDTCDSILLLHDDTELTLHS